MVNLRTGEVRRAYKPAYFAQNDMNVVWFEQDTAPVNTNPDYLKLENGIVIDKTEAEIAFFDSVKEFERIKANEYGGYRYKIEVPFPYVIQNYPFMAFWSLGKKSISPDITDEGVSVLLCNEILDSFKGILESDANFHIFDSEDLNPQRAMNE